MGFNSGFKGLKLKKNVVESIETTDVRILGVFLYGLIYLGALHENISRRRGDICSKQLVRFLGLRSAMCIVLTLT